MPVNPGDVATAPNGVRAMTDWTDGFISMKEVLRLTGLARATIDRLRRRGLFPRSFALTGATRGKVGFLRSEVMEWIGSRPIRPLTPLT